MVKKIGLGVAGLFVMLLVIALFRTFTLPGGADESLQPVAVDEALTARAAQRLGDAITIETISWGGDRTSKEAFVVFHDFLDDTYMQAHSILERTIISEQSLIYRWPGTDPEAKPVALTAHIDVVPVEEGTEESWEQPPFSGAIIGRKSLGARGAR